MQPVLLEMCGILISLSSPATARIDRMSATTRPDAAFLRARRWSLGAVMFCYLFYYTGRQTFGFAIPGIQAELKLDKQTLGWISAAMLWAYFLGKDFKHDPRGKWISLALPIGMALGALASGWISDRFCNSRR